ncbi:iron exporter MbfA [Oharaeibacter diazotrophicus]|uniref:Rubrerythrin n=1 Tax=Oharaeibacter diazotrophicus TaxID=1920512 RepID=A0A4R6R8S8_9HYPH|nr:ferritin family protein [Oharaeibacter diazotrophicus]TDP81987.1 rubrerythrin [Oharaeibacter diazotrophicus]BBE73619.1 rubrerythrin [Pleomorphomonas sp. SM30]GLS75408.1 membrane protein [Oharaeibacter diazotrophicus]
MLSLSRRDFSDLGEKEILALAISSEEEDMKIYATYADGLRADHPASAAMFDAMAAEENEHRLRLIETFRTRFGETIPLIRREHVRGFYQRKPYWLVRPLGLDRVRDEAADMERQAELFYMKAAERTSDAATRALLGSLAAAERGHRHVAERLEQRHLPDDVRADEDAAAHRQFVLTYVQPGLAGLMDGSVSTLAPVFAAAFATQNTWETFLVGTAASIGAGISMGLTEALSDDGSLTGRGSPVARGTAAGVMTAVGGLGHSLPYLIPDFWSATAVAILIVFVELWAISYIRWKYMDTPFLRAAFQIVVGGLLVFGTGILIGSS